MRLKNLIPALCFAAVLPLAAQDTEAGIQGGLVFPQNDLRSAVGGRTGFTFGFHGGIDLGQFRPEWGNLILIAVTEKRTKAEIDGLAAAYQRAMAS